MHYVQQQRVPKNNPHKEHGLSNRVYSVLHSFYIKI